jgi:type II secretory pathway predicted ATPase ExeA
MTAEHAHPWAAIDPRPHQASALAELESLLAREAVKRPITFVGEFGAGKTALARYWLARHFSEPERHYVALGDALTRALMEDAPIEEYADAPGKAKVALRIALDSVLEESFAEGEAVVIDSIEILHDYNIPLLTIVEPYTRAGKVAVVCVPDSPRHGFSFDFPPFECYPIPVDASLDD